MDKQSKEPNEYILLKSFGINKNNFLNLKLTTFLEHLSDEQQHKYVMIDLNHLYEGDIEIYISNTTASGMRVSMRASACTRQLVCKFVAVKLRALVSK